VVSIDDVSARIGEGHAKLREASAELSAAKSKAVELVETFDQLTVEGLANASRAVVEQIEAELMVLAGVRDRLDAARAATEALRARLPGGGSGRASPPAAPIERPAFKPMRTDRTKGDEVRPHIGESKAVATLWDAHGRRVLGLHRADDDGPAMDARWREPWASMPRLRRHVEAHAAARMRGGGDMAMYINLPPCSYVDGCKLNLADLIPEGSTLWVHQVTDNGGVRVHRFRGTGRALDE
jgi:hypothetical protein